MTPHELRDFLNRNQVKFQEKEVQHGRQFKCEKGEIFVVYDTGKVVCQGKGTGLSEAVKGWKSGEVSYAVPAKETAATTGPNKRVFIVYGHDTASRDGLELLLRRMRLEPIVLANLPAAGDTIIEKLEHYLKEHPAVQA
jgi:predicted nucleotide-binding protein